MESTRRSIESCRPAADCAIPLVVKRIKTAARTAAFFASVVIRDSIFRLRSALVGLGTLHFPVILLQHEKSLLLLPMFGHQPLAVEVVLNSRQCAPWAAKIFQHPRCNSPQKWNAFQHGDLVPIEVLLVFLAPACKRIRMVAKARVTPKFAHDERFRIL